MTKILSGYRRKRKIEQSIQDVAGQMDTIREKINELGN